MLGTQHLCLVLFALFALWTLRRDILLVFLDINQALLDSLLHHVLLFFLKLPFVKAVVRAWQQRRQYSSFEMRILVIQLIQILVRDVILSNTTRAFAW